VEERPLGQLRRGFDTIVEFSTGIAAATQAWGLEKPETRLPLVALGKMVDASRPRHMCPLKRSTWEPDMGWLPRQNPRADPKVDDRRGVGRTYVALARTAAILTDKGEVPEQEPVIELLDG
jgi:hypothetical protein